VTDGFRGETDIRRGVGEAVCPRAEPGGQMTRDDPPQRVGPYRTVERLGCGGMGCVYLARSRSGRPVAVKVIRPELAQDAAFRRRFAREVSAARAVSGAFTAPVIDADTQGPEPWLATAYVAGPSLWEAVHSGGPFDEDQLRQLGAGLVEALCAIHAAGVVHRDLKPQNVLLAADGPRVIDFGIATVSGAEAITQARAVVGTPVFMSPEQFRGEDVGPASDVFSLGCVLAFVATGETPFGAGTFHQMVYRVFHTEPSLDGLPLALREVVRRCLEQEPQARPALPELLDELVSRRRAAAEWLPETVIRTVAMRTDDLRAGRGRSPAMPAHPFYLEARALIDAGLTDHMVAGAVGRAASR
jgi:eukaryotic-like serine/threonine-protein kinase